MWIRRTIIAGCWMRKMTPRISAIILAAGKSQRMGQPKMLLPWRDTTVLGQVAKTFNLAGISDIIIITGGDREVVEADVFGLAIQFPVRAVFNPSFEQGGMMSSIQAGFAVLPPDCEAVLIGLGDQPQLEVITLRDILAANVKTRTGIIVPSHENRRGHPVLLDVIYRSEILNYDPQSSLRDFLNAHHKEICYVEAGASVLRDLDTPQEYQYYKNEKS
jgi:molybdenum cofactor cytidylyltransferase